MLFFLNSNRILPDSKLHLIKLVENKFKTASNLIVICEEQSDEAIQKVAQTGLLHCVRNDEAVVKIPEYRATVLKTASKTTSSLRGAKRRSNPEGA